LEGKVIHHECDCGREFIVHRDRVYVAESTAPAKSINARPAVGKVAAKKRDRWAAGRAALAKPSQCSKGCGRVFEWLPGRISHERHCKPQRKATR